MSCEWGPGTASATLVEVFTDRTAETFKGSTITRNPDNSDSAYLIEQEDGSRVVTSYDQLPTR